MTMEQNILTISKCLVQYFLAEPGIYGISVTVQGPRVQYDGIGVTQALHLAVKDITLPLIPEVFSPEIADRDRVVPKAIVADRPPVMVNGRLMSEVGNSCLHGIGARRSAECP